MVSSFTITTTIKIPGKYRIKFDEYVENLRYKRLHLPNIKLNTYFDTVWCDDSNNLSPKKAIQKFKNKHSKEPSYFHDIVHFNWRCCDSDGYLYDYSEKFHNAITLLEYCIRNFFAPRNILLNGDVTGINTEFFNAYSYSVCDNKIIFNESESLRLSIINYREQNVCYTDSENSESDCSENSESDCYENESELNDSDTESDCSENENELNDSSNKSDCSENISELYDSDTESNCSENESELNDSSKESVYSENTSELVDSLNNNDDSGYYENVNELNSDNDCSDNDSDF